MAQNDDPIEEILPDAPMTLSQVKDERLVLYRIGFDPGTTNFSYNISAIPNAIENSTLEVATFGYNPQEDSDMFLPMGAIKKMDVITLEGIDVPTWIISMCEKLSLLSVIKEDLIDEVYIEQQLPDENPICYGLYCGIIGFFGRHASLFKTGRPHIIRTPNPQLKFSYFGIKCPSGKDNYKARKDLSVLIVTALFNRWKQHGLIDPSWVQRLTVHFANKPDDAADAFLLTYTTSMAEQNNITPSVPAMKRLHEWLKAQATFVSEGALTLTVDGAKKYKRYERKKAVKGASKVNKAKKKVAANPLITVLSGAVIKEKKRKAKEESEDVPKKKKVKNNDETIKPVKKKAKVLVIDVCDEE